MTKSYTDLYPPIASFENLHRAFRKAAKGKRGHPSVAAFEFDLESNLCRLEEELLGQTYRPGPYRSFTIRDPKRRLVSAAPFRDRVVHHALCNVIEPIFERTFIGDSYANLVGKGTHAALDRAQALARRYRYVLQCDLEQFFPSVDHQILRGVIARKIADPQALWLVDRILAGGQGVLDEVYQPVMFPGDDLFALQRPRGLPIGNLTSQFWANFYLNQLDQFVKRRLRCPAYLRYVDDFLLFADDKRQLWAWKAEIRNLLVSLRLTLHERESTVYPVAGGIPFLGFRIYPDHRRLKRRNGVAFARRLRVAYCAVAAGNLTYEELQRRVHGWIAHARHGDTYGLRRSLLAAPVPRYQHEAISHLHQNL
ncbi:MAG: RNA-dependent DNA polymerase [Anaerolineae bacterium]|nr:RNA-dependent DNA polymerase [Anaerolineae bacterium]MCB0205845.1 RNA-dependent DNA polymerase [Anaerolineae bacterium]